MKKQNFSGLAILLYAVLFLYSAASKLGDLRGYSSRITDSPLPEIIVPLLTWLLPLVEILVVGLLLLKRFRVWGMLTGISLLVVFTGYLVYLLQYPQVTCACGGLLEKMGTGWHLVLNIAFIFLGVLGVREAFEVQNKIKKSL